MQSQQLRYEESIEKVRVVYIDDEPFILLSDVQNTFGDGIIRFSLNGEPIGFTLDNTHRPIEPLRISVPANNVDIIDCHKTKSSKSNNDNQEMLAEIKKIQEQLVDIDHSSKKILLNTDLLIKKSDAILRQTFELAEYTIPRLFIILPEIKTRMNPMNWWANSYRLYFLCECENERHFAFHEGYEIKEARQFFRKYGPYIQNMLVVCRAALAVSGVVLPQLSNISSSMEQMLPSFLLEESFQEILTSNLNAMDDVVENALKESLPKGSNSTVSTQDVVEGVELRGIASFIKHTDDRGSFGNLYRSTNENGQIRWICLYHYRKFSTVKRLEDLRKDFRKLGGQIRLDNAVVEKSSAKELEEMLDVIIRGLLLFKMTVKGSKIRPTAFDKLLLVAAQQKLIRYIKLEDVVVSPLVGFAKSHLEIISKLEEAVKINKDLTIQYDVSLDKDSMENKDFLLSHFAEHSTERLFLHLYGNDIMEWFSCSGLLESDLQTIRKWIYKSKSLWNVRIGDRDRLVFACSSQRMKASLLTLTNLLMRSPNLRELCYNHTAIEEDVFQALCEALENNSISLKVFNFQENTKVTDSFSLLHLVSVWKNIYTSPKELSNSCVSYIVSMLKSNKSLTEFSLPSIACLQVDDVILIVEALGMHPCLCVVKIGYIPPFPIQCSSKVFDRLFNSTTIEDLTCIVHGKEQLYDLRNALENSKTLKRLCISVFNLSDVEINDDFFQYMEHLTTLQTFSLSFDRTIDCRQLLSYLALGSSVQSLSLTRMSNWQTLISLIETGWKLKSLSLCQCDIALKDIELLIILLKSNSQSITELSLSGNNLSNDSVNKLGCAFTSNSFPLTMLDLSKNSLSSACIVFLLQMLHHNTVLKVLDIRECLKRDVKEMCNPTEVQEYKNALADLSMLNEFVQVRWID